MVLCTDFVFNVTYSDLDDNVPTNIRIEIDGILYKIDKVDAKDVDYTDGVLYTATISFALSSANYSYFVKTSDGMLTFC